MNQDLTVITNTHDRTGPKGSITITKALDPGNLNMDVGDPTFIFTLTGTMSMERNTVMRRKSNSQRQRLKNR